LPSLVDLFYAICQGLGLALATGFGGLLVPLFASVLAHVDVGWNLDGTSWEFVGSEWFIAALFAANLVGYLVRAREIGRPLVLAALLVLGAVLFAASLAEDGAAAWPGLIAGAAAALFAGRIAHDVLAGAARRGTGDQADDAPLVLLAVGAALILAAAALFVPPLSILALVGLTLLAASRRRQTARKYEGLRVLR
jgi:hypothetical protein